ncbi:MAG: hypothetical protein Q8K58_16900 [Acidimicrobiales bacterium]|nr:hypothetical protein [Acidimicrobiales bacterium]
MARSNSRCPPWGGGVDQPALAIGADEAVSGPEVAVEAGRRLVSGAQVVEPGGDVQQVVDRTVGQCVGVACQTGQRHQTGLGVEVCPCGGRLVREATAAGRAPVLAPEAGRPGAVQCG